MHDNNVSALPWRGGMHMRGSQNAVSRLLCCPPVCRPPVCRPPLCRPPLAFMSRSLSGLGPHGLGQLGLGSGVLDPEARLALSWSVPAINAHESAL